MKQLHKIFFVCSDDTDWKAVITEFPLSRTDVTPFKLIITYKGKNEWQGEYKTYRGARNIMGRYRKGWREIRKEDDNV